MAKVEPRETVRKGSSGLWPLSLVGTQHLNRASSTRFAEFLGYSARPFETFRTVSEVEFCELRIDCVLGTSL